MEDRLFHLTATVSTENPKAILPVLKVILGEHFRVEELLTKDIKIGEKGEFAVDAELIGDSAKDLNRSLLSALRKAEKRTSLRAAWGSGKTVEEFFDYVSKKTTEK